MSSSLHDDLGLHQFSKMVAELSDGRHAAIEIDDAGHVTIIAVWEVGPNNPGAHPQPTYPQKLIMEQQQPAAPPEPTPLGERDSEPAKLPPKTQEMLDGAMKRAAEAEAQRGKDNKGKRQREAVQATPPPPQSPIPQFTIYDLNATQIIQSAGISDSLMRQVMGIAPGMLGGAGDGQTEATPVGDKRHIPRDPVFLAKLESVMNDNQFDRRLKGRTRGKLDMTRLYKAATGSESVFTQKSMRKNKKYNIAILVDESSSMGGGSEVAGFNKSHPGYNYRPSAQELAATTSQFLAQHLDKIPGVDLMIIGYSAGKTIHKKFGQHTELDEIKMQIMNTQHSGTEDVPALELAYESLKKQDKGQNIVLYITDGQPNSVDRSMLVLRKYEDVALTIGIGINARVDYMKHNFTIQDAHDLQPQIIKLLEREMTRG